MKRLSLAAATAAVAAISLGVPTAAASAPLPAAPTVHISLNNRSIAKTDDAFRFRPGLIRLSVSGDSNCPVWVIRLHDGYGFADFRHDQYAMFDGDLVARRRLWANSDYLGGVPGRAGQTSVGTLTLPSAGDYVISAYAGKHLTSPIRFHLAGSPQDRAPAEADSILIATPDGQWAGDTQLPTTGTLRFTNNDSVPHEPYLLPIVEGTTLQQMLDWFAANPGVFPPPWLLDGPTLGMMPLDPGATESRTYTNYAPGTYLAIDGLSLDYPPTMQAIVHIGD